MKFRELDGNQKRHCLTVFFTFILIGMLILIYFSTTLYKDKMHAWENWNSYLSDPPEQAAIAEELSATAIPVTVGTYVDNLRSIDLKNSTYRVEFMVWFDWEGDAALDPANNFRVYKGVVERKNIVKELHEGNKNYQLVDIDVTVSKNYKTQRFPLESHQMRFYVESTRPIQEVLFVADTEGSGINRNLTITGYEFLRHDVGSVTYFYDSTHGDPDLTGGEMNSEFVTAFEINRANYGMYFKCFIALAGTITWALIALFICTYHHVDPLGMIPGALFGTVGNIMIGASLLPDALEMGLLEFVNIWGVLIILGASLAIININRVRQVSKDNAYAKYYGTLLFYTVLVFAVLGNILLPVCAYMQM